MALTDDLLFEQLYLNGLGLTAGPSDGAPEPASETNIPAALASAAYGYTRGGLHSPLYAGLFGFFGLQYPLISTAVIVLDAVFLSNTPAAQAARNLYAQHGSKIRSKIGLSGINGRRRCRKGYRRKHGMCVRR